MESAGCIEQKGVIDNIDNGLARVSITSFSACAHCQSKQACGITDSEIRKIDVPLPDDSFAAGDTVEVIMKRHLGIRAAIIAYIVPFVLVIAVLLSLNSSGRSELFSGLVSLLVLIPYFVGLYLFRERLKRTFTFTIRKAG